jgi:DNA-binding GntR family transcriptional regulator
LITKKTRILAVTSIEAYHAIRKRIAKGEIKMGEKLLEIDLAKSLEMSRTPIREALRRLVDDRWLEYTPNRGVRVREWKKKDVLDNFQVRKILECEAVKMAARNILPSQIDEMELINHQLKSMASLQSSDAIQQMTDLNLKFHQLIWRNSGNEMLYEILLKNINIPTMISTYKLYGLEKTLLSFSEHDQIINDFKEGDDSRVGEIMKKHLERASHEFQ